MRAGSYGVVMIVALLAVAEARAASAGRYASKVEGFHDGHFDEVGQLEGCRNAGPGLLFRSGAPQLDTSAGQAALRDRRIALVVDLRAEKDTRALEEAYAAGHGITYVNLGLSAGDRLESSVRYRVHAPAQDARASAVSPVAGTLAVLELVDKTLAAGRNVLVHCKHGEDRTGTIIALWRDCRAARREFDRYSGTWYKELSELFDAVTAARRGSRR